MTAGSPPDAAEHEPSSDTFDDVVEGDDDLRTRIANLERFAHRLAHELGTPLTTARGFASILLGRDDLPPDVRDALVRIERATATAEARLHARVGEAVGEGARPVRLGAVLRDVASSLEGAPAEVEIDVPNNVRVFGDPAVVRRIVEQLLDVLAQRAAEEDDRASLQVGSVEGPDDAESLRFEANARELSADEQSAINAAAAVVGGGESAPQVTGLAAVSRMISGQGGKLWLSDPTSTSGRMALLVQMPKVIDGPSAGVSNPSEG